VTESTPQPNYSSPRGKGLLFQWAVILPVVLVLGAEIARDPKSFLHIQFLGWIAILAVVELLPVPAWRGLHLSLGFPIRLGVAILYNPGAAAVVAFVGTFDPREIDRSRPPSSALFDRAQIALSVLAGSSVFHALASIQHPQSKWFVLLPAVLLATVADYAVNVLLVSSYVHLTSGVSMRMILSQLRLGELREFVLSYLGLSFVGLVIALLYLEVHLWAVAVFILPLVFARQMFFRTMALEQAHKELKDREQVLRALSNRMAEERHDERMQIAGYLHDDLAQMLFRLTLQVEMAKKRLSRNDLDGASKDLDGIEKTKKEASGMVRALIRDLHRSPIGRAGLHEAIQSFAQDAGGRFNTRIDVDVDEVTLPPPIQLLIYQIAREAAMNALKHAEAGTIHISLHDTPDGVELQIGDDGKGFDTEAPPPEGHFGSVMMRERALVAGGTFSVSSELGKGSLISARFPRVWVEEGTLLEAEASRTPGPAEVPVGATTAPVDRPARKARPWTRRSQDPKSKSGSSGGIRPLETVPPDDL
jgi:signal transduction histidine kinase